MSHPNGYNSRISELPQANGSNVEKNSYPVLLRKFISYFLAMALTLGPISQISFANTEQIDNETGTTLVSALKNAVSQGFMTDMEQYGDTVSILSSFEGRDFETDPLTEEEISQLEQIVLELRQTMPKWMDRLIASAKSFEEKGEITFVNPNWQRLTEECVQVGSPNGSDSPLEDFIDGLEKTRSGVEFDWSEFERDLGRDYRDCQKQLQVILEQVIEARKAVESELEALAEKIQDKEEECRNLEGDEAKSCKDELDDLYEDFENKTETYTRMKEYENDSKKTMAILGFLAILAGVALAVYCCPEWGASLAAWGGQTLEDNQDYKESKAVTETRVTGRKRVIENEGDASDEERAELDKELEKEGFRRLQVIDRTEGGVAYEVFQSDSEIRLYLVKSKKILAIISDANTSISDNSRRIYSLSSITDISIDGDPFIEDNRIKLNVRGMGPDTEAIKVTISEKYVGARQYSLNVEN